MLALAAVLAAVGWVADTQTGVQSDVTKLVPTSMPALHNLNTLEKVTGVGGEIDVTVRSKDVATPATVQWMIGYEKQLLSHFGYLEEKGCAAATLCPALSLPDLFSTANQSSAQLTQAQINGFLAAVPALLLAGGDHPRPSRGDARLRDPADAALAPGAGHPVHALPTASAGGGDRRARRAARPGRRGQRLAVLRHAPLPHARGGAARRRARAAGRAARPKRALVPLAPIVMATGWSALVLFLIGIPLNPMSATLGTLVIAISTEFSVLLSERYRQERAAGHDLPAALRRTYRSTGAAVLASGVTAIAGFGVLVFSDITMLRDFGFVTLIDLSVSLVGVLLVLPAVLALSERGGVRARTRTRETLRAAGSARRLRRRARVA